MILISQAKKVVFQIKIVLLLLTSIRKIRISFPLLIYNFLACFLPRPTRSRIEKKINCYFPCIFFYSSNENRMLTLNFFCHNTVKSHILGPLFTWTLVQHCPSLVSCQNCINPFTRINVYKAMLVNLTCQEQNIRKS